MAQTAPCNQPNIHFVESPISAENQRVGTFKYYYQHIRKADDSVPTVIVIPGGPGGRSIDLQPENPYFDWTQIQYGFTEKYNAILTDPRTVGCNQADAVIPVETLTSENVANDVVSIIKALRISNYVLYGHSYGTVVATLIGKRASDGEFPAPKAIIISGTIGHHFGNHKSEVLPSYYRAWANLRTHLPGSIQKLFPKKDDWSDMKTDGFHSLPLEISLKTWANFIFSNLIEGGTYQNGKLVFPLLSKLLIIESQDEKEVLDLKNEVKSYQEPTDGAVPEVTLRPFHDSIWCRELEQNQGEECLAQGFTFERPFDSVNFQIKDIPIVYLHGEFDPSVPIDSAIYHYNSQLNKNKFFLVAKDGGHSTTHVISDCKESFWKSIFAGAIALNDAVKTCVGIEPINPKL